MPASERGRECEKQAVAGDLWAVSGAIRLVEPVAEFPASA